MPTPTRRAAALAAFALFGSLALVACGDDDDGSSDTTTTAPEYVKAPMEEVLVKLPQIAAAGDEAADQAAEGDFEAATATYDELHDIWEEVEGTVKDTDPDAYEAMETAQGLIADGAENENAERVATGAEDQGAAIDEFVAANG